MSATCEKTELEDRFFAFLRESGFPCVGAKSALATGTIETVVARDMRSAWDDLRLHERLADFSSRLTGEVNAFRSFVVLFEQPDRLTEHEFDQLLWARLQSLRDKDHWLSYPRDARVAHDPRQPDFAYSIGGQGYFVVGMHPGASRLSRRTPMPALVFNPFSQFEHLRETGKYDRMSDVIRNRDTELCGAPNPMLAHHGEASAARQFSGLAVDDTWECPLDAHQRERETASTS